MTELFIHPTAVVDVGAIIGEGTRIWHFSHLMSGCRVGSNCTIGQNVFIDNNALVGNEVKIQNNVSVYNGVVLDDHVFVGPSVVFTNVINPRSFIERKSEFKTTKVGRGATIGANATIICGTEIGEYSFIAAGSVVTKSVPAFALVKGNPAKISGWVSRSCYPLVFNDKGYATCTCTQEKYLLSGNRVELHS